MTSPVPIDSAAPPKRSGARSHRGMAPAGLPQLLRRQRTIAVNCSEVEEFLTHRAVRLARVPFSVCLVSDRVMRRYNGRYRGIRKATDVLSFPAGPPEHGSDEYLGGEYLGDILISVETARRNAALYGLRLEDEIKALILHGLLHLLGEDHETDSGRMARAERRWGLRLGLPQTLLARDDSDRLPRGARRRALPSRPGRLRPGNR